MKVGLVTSSGSIFEALGKSANECRLAGSKISREQDHRAGRSVGASAAAMARVSFSEFEV